MAWVGRRMRWLGLWRALMAGVMGKYLLGSLALVGCLNGFKKL